MKKFSGIAVVSFLAICVLLVGAEFLWTGQLHTSGLDQSLNDQTGYIVTARNIAERGQFESTIYYPAKILYYKSHNVPYMPGNYYIRAAFFSVFGYSLFVAFLPNLLSFIGASILLYLIALRTFDQTTAYVATILFMLFPPLVLYSFSAMMENVFIFACLFSFFLFDMMPAKNRYLMGGLTLLPAFLIRETAIFMTFGYATIIFFSGERKSLRKACIFTVLTFSMFYLLSQLPPMSDRPPTFYARLINTMSVHYTDAYALQNISIGVGEIFKLIVGHFWQNIKYLFFVIFVRLGELSFLFFVVALSLFIVSVISLSRRATGNRPFAWFSVATGATLLTAIFLFYDYFSYTGIRLLLFLVPFFLCVLVDSVVSAPALKKDKAVPVVLGTLLVAMALFFAVSLGNFSRSMVSADEYDRECAKFLDSAGASKATFFAAPSYISLDYVNSHYPIRWSFIPDNEQTLRLLASKYPLDFLIIPSRHPLVAYVKSEGDKHTLLDGRFKLVGIRSFMHENYLVFESA